MTYDTPPPKADRTQLQPIIAGLTDGVILIDPDQTIAWANAAALALHGVTDAAVFSAITLSAAPCGSLSFLRSDMRQTSWAGLQPRRMRKSSARSGQ